MIFDATNVKQDENLYFGQFNALRPIRFYTTMQIKFNFNGKEKYLNLLLWNQRWEAVGSLESMMRGGFSALSVNWKSQLFSLNALHTIMFLVMIVSLILGNKYCMSMNESRREREATALKHWDIAMSNGEAEGEFLYVEPESAFQQVCHMQEAYLGQVAIAVLVLTVLKMIIPRAKASGRAKAEKRLAQKTVKK